MKKYLFLTPTLLLGLAGRSKAVPICADAKWNMFHSAIADKSNDEIFDGKMKPRRDGTVVIIDEEKDVLLEDYHKPGHMRCHGGRFGEGSCFEDYPEHVRVFGNRQTVRMDRPPYTMEQMGKGALIGGGIGAFAGIIFGLLLASPLAGLGLLALGAASGALIAKSKADGTPDVFKRDEVTRIERTPE